MHEYDFTQSRCFIDADGTLFNSLVFYNEAIDRLFLGKYTDRSYNEYWNEFNNTYDIIPGSPWAQIIVQIAEFLGYPIPDEETKNKFCCDFEDAAVEIFSRLSYNDFVIDPIIQFCRTYKANGGDIVIHSGTNQKILEQMIRSSGTRTLFTDWLCTDMLEANPADLGKWGYKTELLTRLQDKYADDGRIPFIIGDTKGDGFGAREMKQPFCLVWRGYPKNPYRLNAEENGKKIVFRPSLSVDMRQEHIDAMLKGDKAESIRSTQMLMAYVDDMLDWCNGTDFRMIEPNEQRLWRTVSQAQ